LKKYVFETIGEQPKEIIVEGQKLDCIFYDEPLGFITSRFKLSQSSVSTLVCLSKKINENGNFGI